jgi:tRNA pseudouridine55 synthase
MKDGTKRKKYLTAEEHGLPEMFLVDKPKGISSFDAIRHLRRVYGNAKMGHGGTLDPLASGLMIIGVGAGTKKLQHYLGLPKTYEVKVLFGKRTTTGDLEGEVVEEMTIESLDMEKVREAVKSLVGILNLPVPIFSAVKQDGVALYKKARKQQEIEVPMRDMQIYAATISNKPKNYGGSTSIVFAEEPLSIWITLDVASGVYVRSVVEELGRRIAIPATVQELRRTKIGEYLVENAEKIEYKRISRFDKKD